MEATAMNMTNEPTAPPAPTPPNVVERVMEQMQLMGKTPLHQAAMNLKITYAHFTLIRKLLMLKTWETISPDERTVILTALGMIAQDRANFRKAALLVHGIVRKHWAANTRDGRMVSRDKERRAAYARRWSASPKQKEYRRQYELEKKARKKSITRLDNTLFAIREACTNNDEMEIPRLDEQTRSESLSILDDSLHALWNLRTKIKEAENEGP